MQWRVKTIEKVTDEGEARKSESPTASARHHFRPHSKIQIFKHEIFMKEFFRTLNICQSLMNCFLAKKNFALIFFFFLFSINYNTSIRRSTKNENGCRILLFKLWNHYLSNERQQTSGFVRLGLGLQKGIIIITEASYSSFKVSPPSLHLPQKKWKKKKTPSK